MDVRAELRKGLVIPAHPLALTSARKLDERRQRALTRYCIASGSGGLALGVHTTQFAIRDAKHGLFRPVLELAMDEMRRHSMVKIAGVCGPAPQAIREAELARTLNYDAALLSLGGLAHASIPELIEHTRAVASIMPVVGFYLQPAVGGRVLPFEFWARLVEIDNVVAIKVAPFNRYQTIDVVRAVAESGRSVEISLYTGNDDNIIVDLLSDFSLAGETVRIAGGLLGHWAVWTSVAASHLRRIQQARCSGNVDRELLALGWQVTDSNAALFDATNQFRGCIAGIHEVLRRQGLMQGRWCLDPEEDLSPRQTEEIDRVCQMYPHLQDNAFVRAHLGEWLR